MTVQCDAFFAIGSTHDICQDYALALNISNRSLLIVSDGCSASPSTDIGARILSRCAAQVLLEERNVTRAFFHTRESGSGALRRKRPSRSWRACKRVSRRPSWREGAGRWQERERAST